MSSLRNVLYENEISLWYHLNKYMYMKRCGDGKSSFENDSHSGIM